MTLPMLPNTASSPMITVQSLDETIVQRVPGAEPAPGRDHRAAGAGGGARMITWTRPPCCGYRGRSLHDHLDETTVQRVPGAEPA